MIECVGLGRTFGSFKAVDSLNFEIPKGQVVGFIGPNGAGKTTTMRMLTGYLPPTFGHAKIDGLDVFEDNTAVKHRVGYLPETPPLYPELEIGQYLEFVGTLRNVPTKSLTKRIGEVMSQLGLAGWERKGIHTLSKGYRQRVGLAQAILHEPSVLILDEPTSGLDPTQVAGIRQFLKALAEDRTVILSTHILSEVEKLCDRILMIKNGSLVADAPIHELELLSAQGCSVLQVNHPPELFSQKLEQLEWVKSISCVHDSAEMWCGQIVLHKDNHMLLGGWLYENGVQVAELFYKPPSLEDLFLELVQVEK